MQSSCARGIHGRSLGKVDIDSLTFENYRPFERKSVKLGVLKVAISEFVLSVFNAYFT